MTPLILCPHCGQTDDGLNIVTLRFNFAIGKNAGRWETICQTCGATVFGDTEAEARTRWNCRSSLHAMLTAKPEMVDELFSLLRTNALTYTVYDYDVRLSTGIMPDQLKADIRALVLAWVQKLENR